MSTGVVYYSGYCESLGQYISRGVGVMRDEELKMEEMKALQTLGQNL
jgi:hypothetical protein